MPAIFPSQPGMYVQITDTNSPVGAAVFSIGGLNLEKILIVTKYGYSQQARTQYKSVLSGDVFVYPLGNEMGTLQVSGIVPYSTCENGEGGGEIGKGFQELADFYNENRASNAAAVAKPVEILLPGLKDTIYAYLESFSISGADARSKLFGFDLMFRVAPPEEP